jgi:hypothetical protein
MCLLVWAAGARPACATVVRVDQNAPTTVRDGRSWRTACLTIGAALLAAAPGDEIWVGPGVYREHLVITSGRRLYGGFIGTESRRDQRRGLADLTIILGDASGRAVEFDPAAKPDTVLDGFTVSGAFSAGGIVCAGGSPTIAHNVVRENGDAQYRAITAGDGAAGIFDSGPDAVIDSNLVMANSGNGISGQGHITHNTVVANNGAGFASRGGTPELADNIFAGNMIGVSAAPAGAALRGNCVWGNSISDYDGMTGPTGSGNISADPRFANPRVGNYHLQPDSPCVDAGDPTAPAEALDIDLRPRWIGAATDIGAAESDGRVWRYLSHVVRVSPTGNDDNDGSTWQSAKRTVQAALIDAADGGEIWVAAGTYSNTSGFTLPPFVSMYGGFSGMESERDEREPTLNTTTLSRPNAGYILTSAYGHRVSVVDGFTLAPSGAFRAIGGIECKGASPIIRNNRIQNLAGDPSHGLISGTNAAPLIVDNVVSQNIMNNSGTGLLFFSSGSAPDIERNTFVGNGIAAGYASGIIGMKVSRRIVIRDNVFARNAPSDGYGWLDALQVDAVEVVGNTFASNSGSFGSLGQTTSITFANNIFSGCPGAPPTGGTNICYFNSGDVSGSVGQNGNIAADPMFVDPAHDNYRLKPGSPCLNAGSFTYARPAELDLDGGPRVQDGRPDIGAYERRPSLPPVAAARLALCIAAGMQEATPSDVALLDNDGVPGIGLADAALAIRN